MLVAWVVSGDLSVQCSKQSWSIGIPFVECRNGMMSLGWSTLLGMKMGPLSFNQWIIDGQSMISGNCEVWIFSELMEQHCILIIVMQWSIWVTPGMVNSCWIYVKKNCDTEGNLFYLVGFRFWDNTRVKLDYRPVHMNTLDDEVEPFPPKARVYWELQLCWPNWKYGCLCKFL
jgi:hypothetical protein